MPFQILDAFDIGASAYSQLMKVKNAKDDNSEVSADDNSQRPSFTANWMPKANRVLKMVLASGDQTFTAIEHEPS